MYKLLIFDFDGVLVNSFEYVYAINQQAAAHVNKVLTREQYIKCFYGSFHKTLLAQLRLNPEEDASFTEYKYGIYEDLYRQIELFDFAVKMIRSLSKKGIKMGIVSSAYERSIVEKITTYGIDTNFSFVAGMNKQGKKEKIQECIRLADVSLEESLFVTDTIGDIRDAREAGIASAAVVWGFHTEDKLNTVHPTHVIHTAEELIALV